MSPNILNLREFYSSPLGRFVRRILRAKVMKLWPSINEDTLLAIGYAVPILRQWLNPRARIVSAMLEEQGVVYWPKEGANISFLCSLKDLPIEDESIERVVLMHAIETASDPNLLLREIWRILKGNGRLLIIVPNRRGFWTHTEKTPFGFGRPYSALQLKNSLCNHGFTIEKMQSCLFFPPVENKLFLSLAMIIEKICPWLFPGFGGVLIVEASKQVFKPILVKTKAVRESLALKPSFRCPSALLKG